MKMILSGICGHMGRTIFSLAKCGCGDSEIVAGVDKSSDDSLGVPVFGSFDVIPNDVSESVDCIIDFSHHSFTSEVLFFAVKHKLPVLIATTGHSREEMRTIARASEDIAVFYASNCSLGIALLKELARQTAIVMPDAEIEIIEKHHDRKSDAPSGTAYAIAEVIKSVRPSVKNNVGRHGEGKRDIDEIGIHSIRIGNYVGEHEIMFGTPTQTLTIKHEAHNRAIYAEGAFAAAKFLSSLPKGTVGYYGMKDLLH